MISSLFSAKDATAAGGYGSLSATNVTETSIDISWAAPSGNIRDVNPALYKVCYKKAGAAVGACNGGKVVYASSKPVKITGLTPGQNYKFKAFSMAEKKNWRGKFRNAKLRKAGTYHQATRSPQPRTGTISKVGGTNDSITVRVSYSHPSEFTKIRLCYRWSWWPFSLNDRCRPESGPSTYIITSDKQRGYLDLEPFGTSPQDLVLPGLGQCRQYRIQAYGYPGGKPIGSFIKARTNSTCKDDFVGSVIDDHEQPMFEYINRIDGLYGESGFIGHVLGNNPEIMEEYRALASFGDPVLPGLESYEYLFTAHREAYDRWQEDGSLAAAGLQLGEFLKAEFPEVYEQVLSEARSDSLGDQDLVCDATGRAWIVDAEPGETSGLHAAGECSDGPWSTTLDKFAPVDGGAIPIRFPVNGNPPKPCTGSRVCVAGTVDKVATPSDSLLEILAGCADVHKEFGTPPEDGHCFGHSFTDCWPTGCKLTRASFQVRMKAVRSDATNDVITIYSGGQSVWRSEIKDLLEDGTWSKGREEFFNIDLGDVLEDLDQGVDVSVQDDTQIEIMVLRVGFNCCARACGGKFVDTTCNGQKDSTDAPLGGWTVSLSGSDGARTATTDGDGRYCFDRLQPGTYTLSELAQTGWVQTFPPAPGHHVIEVASGDEVEGLDFGNQLCDVCPKPEGSCCTRDGCLQKTFAECRDLGGIWAGRKACGPETCNPRSGACCLPGGCILTLEEGCRDLGGSWLGEESTCAGAACTEPLAVTATPEVGVDCDRFSGMGTKVTLTIEGGEGPFECEGAGQLQDRQPNDRECVFIGMPPGSYTYGVKGGGNSGPVVVEDIQVEPLFELAVSHTDANNSACNNGTASVEIVDNEPPFSEPPYTFRWQPTDPDQTERNAVGLEPGTYTILVTDDDGCFTSEEVTLACGTPPPGGGGDDPTTVYFRLSSQSVSGGGSPGQDGDLGVEVDLADGLGGSIGFERRLTEQLGLEIGLLYSELDVTTLLSERGAVPFSTEERSEELLVFHLGGNFHLFPSRRTDVYFGPFISFLDYPDPPGLEANDDFALGVVLGFDVPLNSGGWGLSGTLRYIDTDIDLEGLGLRGTVDFDLLSTELGVSFSF